MIKAVKEPERTEPTNYAFYEKDRQIVEFVAKRYGQSASAAARFIVRDWARRNGIPNVDEPTDEPA